MICFDLDAEIFQVFLVNLPNLKVQDIIVAIAVNGESAVIEDEIIIGKCDIPKGVVGNFPFQIIYEKQSALN